MSIRTMTRLATLLLGGVAAVGCETQPDTLIAATEIVMPAHGTKPGAPATLAWHGLARSLVGAHRLSAPASARVYAALAMAQQRAIGTPYQIVNADARMPYDGIDPTGRSAAEFRRGAVAGASVPVLTFFFPDSTAAIERLLAAQRNVGPGRGHPHFQRGFAVGEGAGRMLVARVVSDGFTAPWTGTVPVGPGMWTPTALPPAGVMLGAVKPYFLTSGAQFRSAPPPALGTPAFAADLQEVVTRANDRTPDELALALRWDYPAGTYTPIGYWNEVTTDYIAAYRLDEVAATRVLALVQAATFDALIGCWDAKYHYWLLRPSQADPAVALAFNNPNFPAYPSGHSCASAAAARVLVHFFPERAAELDARVQDAGLSRIVAGIHFRFDVTAGQLLGRQVAEWAIQHSGMF